MIKISVFLLLCLAFIVNAYVLIASLSLNYAFRSAVSDDNLNEWQILQIIFQILLSACLAFSLWTTAKKLRK